VLHNLLRYSGLRGAAAAAAARWAPRLAHLPSPRIALLVGGNSVLHLDQVTAALPGNRPPAGWRRRRAAPCWRRPAPARPTGGRALTAALTAPAYCFHWAPHNDDNPILLSRLLCFHRHRRQHLDVDRGLLHLQTGPIFRSRRSCAGWRGAGGSAGSGCVSMPCSTAWGAPRIAPVTA